MFQPRKGDLLVRGKNLIGLFLEFKDEENIAIYENTFEGANYFQ